MKNFLKVSLVFSVFLFLPAHAQVVVKNDTISGTPYSLTMDSRVEEVIDAAEENCNRIARNTSTSTRNSEIERTNTTSNTVKVTTPDRTLSNAEICRQNPRIMGYKIQLTVVKSNEEAREVGVYFRRRFPNIKVEIDASLRPNYKVMAGSYFTKQSASGDLSRIKQYFKSAIPIQYRVFCVEAK